MVAVHETIHARGGKNLLAPRLRLAPQEGQEAVLQLNIS
jgi:hypothetical protein